MRAQATARLPGVTRFAFLAVLLDDLQQSCTVFNGAEACRLLPGEGRVVGPHSTRVGRAGFCWMRSPVNSATIPVETRWHFPDWGKRHNLFEVDPSQA